MDLLSPVGRGGAYLSPRFCLFSWTPAGSDLPKNGLTIKFSQKSSIWDPLYVSRSLSSQLWHNLKGLKIRRFWLSDPLTKRKVFSTVKSGFNIHLVHVDRLPNWSWWHQPAVVIAGIFGTTCFNLRAGEPWTTVRRRPFFAHPGVLINLRLLETKQKHSFPFSDAPYFVTKGNAV